MSIIHGEGLPMGEKGQRIITPGKTKKQIRKEEKAEETAWAALSGPVYIRQKEQ